MEYFDSVEDIVMTCSTGTIINLDGKLEINKNTCILAEELYEGDLFVTVIEE